MPPTKFEFVERERRKLSKALLLSLPVSHDVEPFYYYSFPAVFNALISY